MKTIGFIGLGVMGAPMAANLLRKGFSVTVFNRTADKAVPLVRLGAKIASSPAEAARMADVVITMVSNDQALEDVYFGENGILSGLRPGTTAIDSSTVSPALSVRLSQEVRSRLAHFIDAPVTGSKPAAEDGTLLFMAGGDRQALEAQRDVLLAMGKEIVYTGPSGSGSTAKLAHNTIVGINAAALFEGMSLAVRGGIDPAAFLHIVQNGGAASKMAELKGPKVLNRDFSVQFSLALMLKDLKLSASLSDQLAIDMPLQEITRQLFEEGAAVGYGDADLSALAKLYEIWIGRTLSSSTTDLDSVKHTIESPLKNRRKAYRLSLEIPVMFSVYQWMQEGAFSGQSVKGVLVDVSEDGMKISSEFPLEKDMFIVIHLPPDAGLPPITGRVIRIDKFGDRFQYGCLLSGLPISFKLQLKNYIDRRTGETVPENANADAKLS
jgi:3-hydroxyisobutyrate dehydrogenase-like beta-hydroxyacid dehydrogenase